MKHRTIGGRQGATSYSGRGEKTEQRANGHGRYARRIGAVEGRSAAVGRAR
jgi:hypothetical protein